MHIRIIVCTSKHFKDTRVNQLQTNVGLKYYRKLQYCTKMIYVFMLKAQLYTCAFHI